MAVCRTKRWSACALTALLAACGDDGPRVLPDAPWSGDAVDAPDDVPAGGSVTVTVWDQGERDPAAVILLHTADGTIAQRVMTDANGVATGEVPTGGMITVAQRGVFTTIVQAAGGDSIVVGGEVAPVRASATLTVPAAPSGTTNHVVVAPCASGGSPTTTITLTVFAPCTQPTPVLAIARGGQVDQAFLVGSATIVEDGTTDLAGTWESPAQFAWSVTNLPAPVTQVAASIGSRIGTRTPYSPVSALPAPGGGATSATVPVAPAYGDGTQLRYFLIGATGSQGVTRAFATTSAPTSDTFDAAHLLPWVESVSSNAAGMTWTQSSGDAYDGAIATFEFQYKTATFLTWRVIAPASARQVALPVLPPDLATRLTQTDRLSAHVSLYESDAFDYAAMRAKGGTEDFARDRGLPAVYTLRTSSR